MSTDIVGLCSLPEDVLLLVLDHLGEADLGRLFLTRKKPWINTQSQPCVRCNPRLSGFFNNSSRTKCTCVESPVPLYDLTCITMSPLRMTVCQFMASRLAPLTSEDVLTPMATIFIMNNVCCCCRKCVSIEFGSNLCRACLHKHAPAVPIQRFTRTELQTMYCPFGTREEKRAVVLPLIDKKERSVSCTVLMHRLKTVFPSEWDLMFDILSRAKVDRLSVFVSHLKSARFSFHTLSLFLKHLLSTYSDSAAILKQLNDKSLDLYLLQTVSEPRLLFTMPLLVFPQTCMYLLSGKRSMREVKTDPGVLAAWPLARSYSIVRGFLSRFYTDTRVCRAKHLAKVVAWTIMMESVDSQFMLNVARDILSHVTIKDIVLSLQIQIDKLAALIMQYAEGEVSFECIMHFNICVNLFNSSLASSSRIQSVWGWAQKIMSYHYFPTVHVESRLQRLLWAVQLGSLWHDKSPYLLHSEKVYEKTHEENPLRKGFITFDKLHKLKLHPCIVEETRKFNRNRFASTNSYKTDPLDGVDHSTHCADTQLMLIQMWLSGLSWMHRPSTG